MIRIAYTGAFLRQAKKLYPLVQEELIEATESFKNRENHSRLRVHKLHGELSGCFSFSVNFRYRVVFEWTTKTEVMFHSIGDHSIYDWCAYVLIRANKHISRWCLQTSVLGVMFRVWKHTTSYSRQCSPRRFYSLASSLSPFLRKQRQSGSAVTTSHQLVLMWCRHTKLLPIRPSLITTPQKAITILTQAKQVLRIPISIELWA